MKRRAKFLVAFGIAVVLVGAILFWVYYGPIPWRYHYGMWTMRKFSAVNFILADGPDHLHTHFPAASATIKGPPVKFPELLDWIRRAYVVLGQEPDFLSDADLKAGAVLDEWGHPFIVIAMDGQIVALASRGENGQWEEGKGDDMVFDLVRHGDEPALRLPRRGPKTS